MTGVQSGLLRDRPFALYLSTNIPGSGGIESTWGGAGWALVNYGQGGGHGYTPSTANAKTA